MHSLWALASVLYPKGREKALRESLTDPKATAPPEEHFGCIDDLYGVGAFYEYEWEYDLSPAWRHVGRHVKFVEDVERLAERYIRNTLGVIEGQEIPEVSLD